MHPERQNRARGALLGLAAAGLPLALIWGFTVDDALISARMAHHLVSGVGYRFNEGGAVVDAVTPLGFAHLLAPFAAHGALGAFSAARVLGALAWLAAAAFIGARLAASGTRRVRYSPLVVLAASLPLAAWAGAGMETGVVVALAAFATARSPWAALVAGIAAALRPELLPWAMTLSLGAAFARHAAGDPKRAAAAALGALGLALLPATFVASVRLFVFGTAMPLAVLAKPSTFDIGLSYGWAALWLCSVPLLVMAPFTWLKVSGHDRALIAAGLVHFPAIALAGGDWMPLFRLAVPVLPTLLIAAGAVAEQARLVPTSIRTVLALAAALLLWVQHGRAARGVWETRSAVIDAARPALDGARAVASIDVGWVGVAAPPAAAIVDLAGVTDPRVAHLPGGHTSKALPDGFLAQREVDAVVTLASDAGVFRAADRRVEAQAAALGFRLRAEVPLGTTGQRYRILRPPPDSH